MTTSPLLSRPPQHLPSRRGGGLPPEAARLLAVMFPNDDVCRRTVGSFAAEVQFDHASARRLLLALLSAGFVSKAQPGERGLTTTYRLHLPPRQQ